MRSEITFIILSFVILLLSCGEKQAAAGEEETGQTAVPVVLAAVETVSRTESVQVAGTVSSLKEARLSFKTGGVIRNIGVQEGQAVRRGQLLASLDMTEIEAQVNQAQYSYEKAQRDLGRVTNLVKDTAATLEQLQNASTAVDMASRQLDIARFNQSFSKITSPVDGVVLRKLMNEGEITGPGTPVLIVASNRDSDWVVKVGVSDRDWARLRTGDKAVIALDAYPEERFEGKITALAQAADPMTRLYEIEIALRPGSRRMASGLFAKAELFPSQSRSYAVIPAEALLEGHGKEGFVYTVRDGRAQKVAVGIGYLDQHQVLITSGLDSIGKVVTGGSAFLKEGAPVHVK